MTKERFIEIKGYLDRLQKIRSSYALGDSELLMTCAELIDVIEKECAFLAMDDVNDFNGGNR